MCGYVGFTNHLPKGKDAEVLKAMMDSMPTAARILKASL